jgi:kynureninase
MGFHDLQQQAQFTSSYYHQDQDRHFHSQQQEQEEESSLRCRLLSPITAMIIPANPDEVVNMDLNKLNNAAATAAAPRPSSQARPLLQKQEHGPKQLFGNSCNTDTTTGTNHGHGLVMLQEEHAAALALLDLVAVIKKTNHQEEEQQSGGSERHPHS